MSHPHVVLRELAVDGIAVMPARSRVAAPAAIDTLASALQEAREEGLRQGHELGLQAGYEEGLRQGRADAAREAQAQAAALEEEAAAMRQERQAEVRAAVTTLQDAGLRWLELAEEEMVVLCYRTLARILGAGGGLPDLVRSQVAQALGQWRESGVPALHVHPSDAQQLQSLPAGRPFTCVADPEVRFGGCIVKGAEGALDARLDRILEEIKAALLSARDESSRCKGEA